MCMYLDFQYLLFFFTLDFSLIITLHSISVLTTVYNDINNIITTVIIIKVQNIPFD